VSLNRIKYQSVKKLVSVFLVLGFALLNSGISIAQISFQKTYPYSGAEVKTYDAISCSDGGYAMAGIVESANPEIVLIKMNCAGDIQWSKSLGAAQSIYNEDCRILETPNNKLLLMHSSGAQNANVDITLSKLSLAGILEWKKSFGGGSLEVGHDMIISGDNMILVTGSTASIGSDSGSSNFTDLLIFKADLDGNLEWSKSFGNQNEIETGYGIEEISATGDLVVSGEAQFGGFSYAVLIRTDLSGNRIWSKAYGLGNHFNSGDDLILSGDGNILLSGTSTNFRTDFQSSTDPMLLRINPLDGSLLDGKIFLPEDDANDEASRIISDGNGNFLYSFDTESYDSFTAGTSPNKQGLIKIDAQGNLIDALILNTGGCYASGIAAIPGNDFLYFGYSNQYSDPCCTFEPLLIRMEADLNSGCNQNDVLAISSMELSTWNSADYVSLEGTGIISFNFSGQGSLSFNPTNTVCEQFPPISADFVPQSTCIGQSINLESVTTGNIVFWSWNMDNSESIAEADVVDYTYTEPGTYTVNLFVSDGCRNASMNHDVEIYETPEIDPGVEQTINEGESIELGGNPTGAEDWSYSWTPISSLDDATSANPSASPTITTAYTLAVEDAFGCEAEATVIINVIEAEPPPPVEPIIEGEPFIPNIFSPNGDELNDILLVYGGPYTSFDFEVFNRWGNSVFRSEDQKEGWDGIFKGDKAPSAVYYYQFRGTHIRGEGVELSGNVTLIR